jgi:hypothetical protein
VLAWRGELERRDGRMSLGFGPHMSKATNIFKKGRILNNGYFDNNF